MSPAEVLTALNALGGRHGIGRLDLVENRYVGMKSRGCYETPGGTILLKAHRGIESITLDREVAHLKDDLMPRYASLIYNGYWWSPERRALQVLIDHTQANVNGFVRLKLYKGSVGVVARDSKDTLFDQNIATFDDDRARTTRPTPAASSSSMRCGCGSPRTRAASARDIRLGEDARHARVSAASRLCDTDGLLSSIGASTGERMSKLSLAAVAVAASFAASFAISPAARAQSFAAKPGAWETTTTMTGNAVPPEALAKMPPDRRAMVEKMLADNGAGNGQTATRKSCVTQEDLDRMNFGRQPKQSGCTNTVTSRTSTKVVMATSCSGPPPMTGTMTFEAKTPESVVGSIDQQRPDGSTFHVGIVGKWLGASCEGVDPSFRPKK